MKRWFLILLMLSICFRILSIVSRPQMGVNLDSVGYYDLGIAMKERKISRINQYRTPFYPLFLAGISAEPAPSIIDPMTEPIMEIVGYIQAGIGILSVLLIFVGLIFIPIRPVFAFGIAVFFACDPFMMIFEREILTDTFALFISIAVTVLGISMIRKISVQSLILFLVISIIGFSIRPAFTPIPVIILVILGFQTLRSRHVNGSIPIILALILYLLIPFGYAKINEATNGYRGIQQVSDIDILGRILEFSMPLEAGKRVPWVYEKVTEYKEMNGIPHPFRFLDWIDPTIYQSQSKMNDIHTFSASVIAAHPIPYITQSLFFLPYLFTEPTDIQFIDTGSFASITIITLQSLYQRIQPLTLVFFLLYPCVAILFFINPTKRRTALMMMGSIVCIVSLMTVCVVYHEGYGRLAVMFRPHLIIFIILSIVELITLMKTKRTLRTFFKHK